MRICLVLFTILVAMPLAVCAETERPVGAEEEQIVITADRLEADQKNRTVVFYGDVQARKADLIMYADKMSLYYAENEEQGVDRVEIDGQLRIVQGDRIATADHGIFMNREGRILLSGNSEVHQNGNSIVGDEIIYYIDDARSVVKSQPDSRVKAVFSPGGQE